MKFIGEGRVGIWRAITRYQYVCARRHGKVHTKDFVGTVVGELVGRNVAFSEYKDTTTLSSIPVASESSVGGVGLQ